MTTFLQIMILFAVAAVAILVVYLIDRVNNLQRLTRLLQADAPAPNAESDANGPFGDLSGQRLWAALSGIPTEGWDKTALDLVRNRYALVLRKHVEDVFYEGVMHSKSGTQALPSSTRSVRTLRGTVDSWIPVDHAMTIYKAGLDVSNTPPEGLAAVRTSLDNAVSGLFDAVAIKLPRPISENLIPMTDAERGLTAPAAALPMAAGDGQAAATPPNPDTKALPSPSPASSAGVPAAAPLLAASPTEPTASAPAPKDKGGAAIADALFGPTPTTPTAASSPASTSTSDTRRAQ